MKLILGFLILILGSALVVAQDDCIQCVTDDFLLGVVGNCIVNRPEAIGYCIASAIGDEHPCYPCICYMIEAFPNDPWCID